MSNRLKCSQGRDIRGLPARLRTTITLHIDPELLDFVIERPFGHPRQLQGHGNPTTGTTHGEVDEKPLDLSEGVIPRLRVTGFPEEMF
jgi:hypothetical protein